MEKELVVEQVCPECGADYPDEMEHCPVDGAKLRILRWEKQPDVDHLLGKSIDNRFSVEKILGEGGMGKVYAGRQLSVGRKVAIKVLRSELCNDDTIVKRFFREAQVISRLSHPNIVHLIDFGQDVEHSVLYLVMEYIEGKDLSGIVSRHRLRPEFAVDVIVQTCEALSEPHSYAVIHRDLKPENLMMVPISDGRVQIKVVDFGIAQALQSETRLTQTGSVFGTLHYMAPEQAHGNEVTPSTDVYALGCILFELLTGSTPFSGESSMELLLKHVQAPPPRVIDQIAPGPGVAELSQLTLEMMAKEPEDRPASVLAVRDRLERIRRGHQYPPVRVDVQAPRDMMYRPWVLDRVEVRPGTSSNPVIRQTGSPISTYSTGPRSQITPDADTGHSTPQQQIAQVPSGRTAVSLDHEVPQAAMAPEPRVSRGALAAALLALLFVLVLASLVLLNVLSSDDAEAPPEDMQNLADMEIDLAPIKVSPPYAPAVVPDEEIAEEEVAAVEQEQPHEEEQPAVEEAPEVEPAVEVRPRPTPQPVASPTPAPPPAEETTAQPTEETGGPVQPRQPLLYELP